jgi:hypothetical protein
MHLVKLRVLALRHSFERAMQDNDPLRLDKHPAQSQRDVVHAPELLEQHSPQKFQVHEKRSTSSQPRASAQN